MTDETTPVPGATEAGTEAPPPPPPPPPTSGADPAAKPKAERPPLIDAAADLLQTFVDYLRTEAEDLMRDKVVLPAQKLGITVASAMAAGCLFALGVGFIAVGLLILLATWLTWPGALILIGTVLLVGAGIFTYLKVRNLQHEREQAPGPGGQVLSVPADAPGTPPSDPRRTP